MISASKIVQILNKKHNIFNIDYAIVVGSGLIASVPDLTNQKIVSYESLKMPPSKVKGHTGRFVFGEYMGKKVVIVSRMHFYESGDMQKVRLPYEILAGLNSKTVILLTSSGGINKSFKVGDIMLISDHINFTGFNPLIGIDKLEFTPMSNCYDNALFEKIEKIAERKDVDVRKGVHIQLSGPSYETNAEIEVCRSFGADTVSMSTAYDCIVCNYLKMKVVGISSVVNTFGNKSGELSHEEVLENAKKACNKIKVLLENLISEGCE